MYVCVYVRTYVWMDVHGCSTTCMLYIIMYIQQLISLGTMLWFLSLYRGLFLG